MMIVKKIPILQGFPALETVKYLSNTKNELSEYNPIFYDIETTGLSRYTAVSYTHLVPISLAMIPDNVVLPRPGGP